MLIFGKGNSFSIIILINFVKENSVDFFLGGKLIYFGGVGG